MSLTPALDQTPADPADAQGGYALLRSPDGQFYADVAIGTRYVRMMIDPAAETVLLTPQDAERMGIEHGVGFTRTILPTVALGPVAAAGVDAVVAPDLPVSLLGASFLDHASVTVERDRIVLR